MSLRMLTEREAALVRDNAASGTADRRGLYAWSPVSILALAPVSLERQDERKRLRLPPLVHVSRRPRCRTCGNIIEEHEKVIRFREFIEVPDSIYTRQHSGFIHADECRPK